MLNKNITPSGKKDSAYSVFSIQFGNSAATPSISVFDKGTFSAPLQSNPFDTVDGIIVPEGADLYILFSDTNFHGPDIYGCSGDKTNLEIKFVYGITLNGTYYQAYLKITPKVVGTYSLTNVYYQP